MTAVRAPLLREYVDTVPTTTFDRTRGSAFSYACAQCAKCCHYKVIRIGPYELLRLARNRGMSTTEFLREHTEAGGTVLRVRDDHSCTFLDRGRCAVHADRPLACRIYPLGWYRDSNGDETFGVLEGHPESEGTFGTAGTVDEYCASQGLEPYLQRAREYIALHDRLLSLLKEQSPGAEAPDLKEPRHNVDRLAPGELASRWLDVDAVVEAHCAERGIPVPDDIAAIIELHQRALEAWAEGLGG